jgi:hypothetical protein
MASYKRAQTLSVIAEAELDADAIDVADGADDEVADGVGDGFGATNAHITTLACEH